MAPPLFAMGGQSIFWPPHFSANRGKESLPIQDRIRNAILIRFNTVYSTSPRTFAFISLFYAVLESPWTREYIILAVLIMIHWCSETNSYYLCRPHTRLWSSFLIAGTHWYSTQTLRSLTLSLPHLSIWIFNLIWVLTLSIPLFLSLTEQNLSIIQSSLLGIINSHYSSIFF